jgi:hypothetical protein
MSRPSLLFVTYYRVAPVGQLGVFKRCSRMMERLLDNYDVHLVHFGGLPQGEPTFAAIADRVVVHDIPLDTPGDGIERAMRRARPDAVVFGEAPLRGPFRLSHRVATSLGLWQVGVENAFDREFAAYARREWPDIDRWLFFGMLDVPVPTRLSADSAVVPPLLRFPEGFGSFPRDRITVIAYDQQTLLTAARLLTLLPACRKIDFFVSAESRAIVAERGIARASDDVRILEFPSDATIYDSLSRARIVLGKAGYGQIVESLQLGARIVCRSCVGGINDGLLPEVMRPYVLIVRSDDDLARHLPQVTAWLAAPPVDAWADVAAAHPDTITLAADTLATLVAEGTTAPRRTQPRVPPSPALEAPHRLFPRAFALFAWLVEQKRWPELRDQLDGATVWAFDRPLAVDELIGMLERSFVDAVDLKILRIGPMTRKFPDGLFHITQTCALMWGERGSWRHHEVTFDLHLGCRNELVQEKLAYVGVTGATPDPEAAAGGAA